MSDFPAIDVHTHVVPEKFPAYAGRNKDVPWPSMQPAHACHAHVIIQGKNYRTVHQGSWATADRLKEMDERSIGMQCLSPMPELLSYWLPVEDARVLIRYINDCIAGMVASNPARFCGLGGVPLQDPELAIRELEYLMKELKFAGVEIASHVNDVSIGDPRFEPFFAAAEALGASIFVHGLRPVGMERVVGPVSEQAACFPSEMGFAVASMVTGGMSERHPKLRMAFSHGGGVTAMLMARLDRAYDITPKFRESLPQKPSSYAKRFYYDSIVFDPDNLAHILKAFGTTQVLVGSDYPFAMGDPDPVKFLNRCSLEPGVMRSICCDNALRFLGR